MPLTGKHKHQIDDKGRFRVPAKIRPDLGDGFYIMCGPKGSLLLMPKAEAEIIFDKVKEVSLSEDDTQSALLMIGSSTEKAEEDAQGRIVLTKEQLQHAGIKKNVITVGALWHAELWAEEEWERFATQNADVRKQFTDLKQRGV